MVLGDVEEAVTIREVDEETEEEIVKVFKSLTMFLIFFKSNRLFILYFKANCGDAFCSRRYSYSGVSTTSDIVIS